MDAIVAGKQEKVEGSVGVFKSVLTFDLTTVTGMVFTQVYDESFYNTKYYLRLITVPDENGIISTLLTPVPYTLMTEVPFKVFYANIFRSFLTDISTLDTITNQKRLQIIVNYSEQTPSQVFTSVEIGTLE